MGVANLRSAAFAIGPLLLCVLITSLGVAQQAGTLTIRAPSLSSAFVSQAYRVQLEAQNGTTPYKWLVSRGSLPKGLSLSEDGLLSGVPLEAGQFHFVVTVADSAKPAQQQDQELVLQVLAPLLAKWGSYPKVNGQRIEGSLKVSNQTGDGFDLTVIVVAVNENGRATALGYQHFTLEKNIIDKEIPFGENLPYGSYQVNADVVAEVPASNAIHRKRLVSNEPLQVVQQP
jgi:Putative Ig domain